MLVESMDTTEFVSLTPGAVNAIKDLLAQRNLEGYALRIYVAGGGCSGIQYGMALESNIRELDFTGEFDGVSVVVDEVSIEYLRGATVDFIKDERGSGFKIDNPNIISGCSGCGSADANNASGQGSGCSGCG